MNVAGEKKYKTEWTFSFDQFGKDIGEFVKNLGGSSEESIRQAEFMAPLAGTTSARVRIDFSVGESVLRSLTNLDNLIEADLTYVGDINFTVAGEAEKTVTLSQVSKPSDWARNIVGWIGSQGKLRWDVGLTTEIPMALEIHAGIGKVHLDLSELDLTDLQLYCGTGELEVTLPARSTHYSTTIHSGVGEVDIRVPAGAVLDLLVRGGAGELDVEVGEGAAVTARIDGGIGECSIHLPVSMPARVEATTGIGGIEIAPRMAQVNGADTDFMSSGGTWQTPDFADASSRFALRYSGGIGALHVR